MPDYIFIYDHQILKGKEDSDHDPTEAILFFYPISVAIDFQHSLCAMVMGFCQMLTNTFQSPPKVLHLDSGASIGCIHEPPVCSSKTDMNFSNNITFSLYSDDTPAANVHSKCEFFYDSLIFYLNECLQCYFRQNCKKKSKFLNLFFDKLLPILNYSNRLSSIFRPIPYGNRERRHLNKLGPLFYQTVVSMMDSVINQSKNSDVFVLGGAIFYKNFLLMSQIPVNISSLYSLIIDFLINTEGNSKAEKDSSYLIDKIKINTENLGARNGVYLFKISLNDSRLKEIQESCEIKLKQPEERCCENSNIRRMILYFEHHSDVSISFLIDEPDSEKIDSILLRSFSDICFHNLGKIEADIAMNFESNVSEWTSMMNSVGNVSEWTITYDEMDNSLNVVNTSQASSINSDWEEKLVKKTSVLHDIMTLDQSVNEVKVNFSKENLSATRTDCQQVYTLKKIA